MTTATATRKKTHKEIIDAEIAEAAEAENLLALTAEQAEKVHELRRVRAEMSALRHEEAALSAEVKGWLHGYEGATLLGRLLATITHRAGRRTVDYELLARKWPKVYAKVVSKGAEVPVLHVHRG